MTIATVHGEKTRASLSILNAGIHQAAELAVRSAVEAARDSAKGTTQYSDRTGGTRASTVGEAMGIRGTVQVGGAARFLENGTQAHVIVAHGRSLRFVVNGQTLFRKWARHPGTRPRPFMHEAARVGEMALDYGCEFYVSEAIRRA